MTDDREKIESESTSEHTEADGFDLSVPHGVHPGSGTVALGGETKGSGREA